MLNFFASIWEGFVGVLFPAGRNGVLPSAARWTLHILLLILALIGFYFLNRVLNIAPNVTNPFLRTIFLPVVVLLGYFALWAGWYLWTLLAFDSTSSAFPDIDAAWDDAVAALGQAGIRLSEVPLFLIVGRPETGVRTLFEAAHINLTVRQTPGEARAPVHVFADRDAVYVSCEGASLLGRQAGILALEEMGFSEDPGAAADEGPSVPIDQTMMPQRKKTKIVDALDDLDEIARKSHARRLRRSIGKALGPDFLGNPAEVQRLSARLAHVCQLIARDRQPFCPINGMLLLVPLGGTDTDIDARQTADAARIDLAIIRNNLRLDCPIFALLCDMESQAGFREFIRQQEPVNLLRRVGQRFPFGSSLPPEQLPEQLRASIRWLCGDYLQDSICKCFQQETADNPDHLALFSANASVAMLLDEMRNRAGRLGDILSQAVSRDDQGPLMYGGCYLAATGGRDEQAFVQQVFKRLLDEQNTVAWTRHALDDDARAHSQTRFGYFTLFVAWVGLAAAVAWFVLKR